MGKFQKPQFDLPEYKKEATVMTPDGPGVIKKIERTSRGYFYLVNNKFYQETELNKHLNGTKKA